jgi:hypothetical protein
VKTQVSFYRPSARGYENKPRFGSTLNHAFSWSEKRQDCRACSISLKPRAGPFWRESPALRLAELE